MVKSLYQRWELRSIRSEGISLLQSLFLRRGFGVRYGKSRLNVDRVKCMQEIVCRCSGRPWVTNSHSTRCFCPALIRLLHSKDNGWCICEHRDNHSLDLSASFGEWAHWPSHKHIDSYTNDPVKQLSKNNVNLEKVYNIVGSFFRKMENIPFHQKGIEDIFWQDQQRAGR
ncbi:hypothetical protein ACQ4PT_006671 [Festuca glaucescens]